MHAVCLSLVLLSAAPDEIDAPVIVLFEGRVQLHRAGDCVNWYELLLVEKKAEATSEK